MLRYTEIPSQKSLKNFVRKFWVLDNVDNPLPTAGKYTLPNGCFTLAFVSGNGVSWDNQYGHKHINDGIYLVGQTTKRLKISLLPYTKAIMAQLNPWAAPFITGLPLSELTDSFLTLDYLNKVCFTKLDGVDKLNENAVVSRVYEVLGQRFNAHLNHADLLQALCLKFAAEVVNPLLTMDDVASYAGYSKRYIEKKFVNHIGMSPKSFYAILRMRRLIDDLNSGGLPLANVYHKYGYYDQSHFIKSYGKVMDSRPTAFKQHEYILPFLTNG